MAGNTTEAGRSVTSKITSILLTFTEGSEHSLTEIARLAGLPISTAHRLTSELASWRLLERTEDGQYRAGLPLRMIGTVEAARPASPNAHPACWRTWPPRPRAGPGSACCTSWTSPTSRSSRAPGRRRVQPGGHAAVPPNGTGPGVAGVLAGPQIEMTILRGLRPYTQHTVTSPDRFRRALAVTRLSRVAVTRWELEAGVCGVAMPVFGPGGEVVAAIELAVGDLRAGTAAGDGRAGHRLPQPVARTRQPGITRQAALHSGPPLTICVPPGAFARPDHSPDVPVSTTRRRSRVGRVGPNAGRDARPLDDRNQHHRERGRAPSHLPLVPASGRKLCNSP